MHTSIITATRASYHAVAAEQRWSRALRDAQREHAITGAYDALRRARHAQQQLDRARARRAAAAILDYTRI
jgi:hypothetical protein